MNPAATRPSSSRKEIFRVVICGAGNEAHVMAAYAAQLQNISVSIYKKKHAHDAYDHSVTHHSITAHHRNGVQVTGTGIRIVDSPDEVFREGDMIFIAVPTSALKLYLEAIEPHVRVGTAIGIIAQTGSVDWETKAIFKEKYSAMTWFYLLDMPWACRIREFGVSVDVLGTKDVIDVFVVPRAATAVVFERFNELFGMYAMTAPVHTINAEATSQGSGGGDVSAALMCSPAAKETTSLQKCLPSLHYVRGILCMSLTVSAAMHTGILYGKFGGWNGTDRFFIDEPPLFYHGVNETTAKTLHTLSAEGMGVVEELSRRYPSLVDVETDAVSLHQWLLRAYPHEIMDRSSLERCLLTNRAYAGLRHPMAGSPEVGFIPDTTSRYWTEDLACHLVLARGVAEMLDVPTPLMDEVIAWMQKCMGVEYLCNGRLCGKDIQETICPQNFGLTIEDIIDVHLNN
jgi:opine dehydrogenase